MLSSNIDSLAYFIDKLIITERGTSFLHVIIKNVSFLVPATAETTSQTKGGNKESAMEAATTQFIAALSATLSTLSKSLSTGANSKGKIEFVVEWF